MAASYLDKKTPLGKLSYIVSFGTSFLLFSPLNWVEATVLKRLLVVIPFIVVWAILTSWLDRWLGSCGVWTRYADRMQAHDRTLKRILWTTFSILFICLAGATTLFCIVRIKHHLPANNPGFPWDLYGFMCLMFAFLTASWEIHLFYKEPDSFHLSTITPTPSTINKEVRG